MPVLTSDQTEECDGCHGPIEPGEPFVGPDLGRDGRVLCWDCAADDYRERARDLTEEPEPGKLF